MQFANQSLTFGVQSQPRIQYASSGMHRNGSALQPQAQPQFIPYAASCSSGQCSHPIQSGSGYTTFNQVSGATVVATPQAGQNYAYQPTEVLPPPPVANARDGIAHNGPGVRRIHRNGTESTENRSLSAVVVTICEGTSYDRLFQEVPQEGDAGMRVSTYTATGKSLQYLLNAIQGRLGTFPSDGAWNDFRQLLVDMRSVEAQSVVFNWECCSGCTDQTFGGCEPAFSSKDVVMDLMYTLLSKGHMVMCSDFSLKALVNQWCERRLGPNPFVKVGEFGGSMQINFDPALLAACPSAQLQKVGEMCKEGFAEVQALPSTIAFTIDKLKTTTSAYKLELLTVASRMAGIDEAGLPDHLKCEVAGHSGTAGHVLLRYPSGGLLFVSAGHWIELTKIGVSEERLLQVAAASYGQEYANTVQQQFASCSSVEARSSLVQSTAARYVQQSAPCSYSVRKS